MAPVVRKGRRLAAENSRWRVYYDHLADQKGNEVPDYLVLEGRHAHADRVTGVAVLPVLDDKLVLLRVFRHPLARDSLEAVRGFIDEGESADAAALRELTEETGLRCRAANLVPLGGYAPEPGTMAARGKLFAALGCEGTPRSPDDELGLGAIAMVERARMAELIASGAIEDAATLILYYRFCTLQ